MSRNVFRCPWWAGYSPWASSPPSISSWNPQVNGRPSFSLRPSGASTHNSLGITWSPQPSCWIHVSNLNMASKRDEPLPKRMRTGEEEQVQRNPSRKGSSSSAKGPRVPPIYAPPIPPPPPKHSAQVKITTTQMPLLARDVRRRWEDFNPNYSELSRWNRMFRKDPENFDFTVLSYNILSQDLLEDNSHLYGHCRRPLLTWSFRLPNILKELEDMNADILCLQEVQENHYQNQIKPSLESLGYHCEYKTRTGNKPDGCAICFKSSKFSLVSVTPVEYYRPNMALLNRDNIGLVLLLQPKSQRAAAPVICVANTHLLYNPKRGDIKLTQLAILLAEIASVAFTKDRGFCPIVLCGDFNSVPGSPLHSFIREGRLDYKGLTIGKVSGQEQYPRGQKILSIPIWPESLGISQNCVYEKGEDARNTESSNEKSAENSAPTAQVESSLHHQFSLSSVYSHFFPGSGVPEVTTCHSRCALTVDYIFYSAALNDLRAQLGTHFSQNGLQLLGRLSLLTEQDLWSVNGLPNETNSSDHLSLLAKFRLEI